MKNIPADKIVLITGCDSGFGRDLAHSASDIGFDVVAVCLTKEGAKALTDVAATVVADLATPAGITAAIEAVRQTAERAGGSLWALVNNAGVSTPGNVEWLNPDECVAEH